MATSKKTASAPIDSALDPALNPALNPPAKKAAPRRRTPAAAAEAASVDATRAAAGATDRPATGAAAKKPRAKASPAKQRPSADPAVAAPSTQTAAKSDSAPPRAKSTARPAPAKKSRRASAPADAPAAVAAPAPAPKKKSAAKAPAKTKKSDRLTEGEAHDAVEKPAPTVEVADDAPPAPPPAAGKRRRTPARRSGANAPPAEATPPTPAADADAPPAAAAPTEPPPTPADAEDHTAADRGTASAAAIAAAPASAPETPAAPATPPQPVGPSAIRVQASDDGSLRRIVWQPAVGCPAALATAAAQRLDDDGGLRADDDAAWPLLRELAAAAGHTLQIDAALWPLLAAVRDARRRVDRLQQAYPDGADSPALARLLRAPLAPFQAEGALCAAAAGRLLIADDHGLGKNVQAIAAAELLRRHFGVERIAVLCTPALRARWQRDWLRFAGLATPQVQTVEGATHRRQSLWSESASVRILSPEAIGGGAAADHAAANNAPSSGDAAALQPLADWAPQLLIVDEPQRLPGWQALTALPAAHVLVLCGAPLDQQPALLEALVGWLDDQRQGALAAVRRLQAAKASAQVLSEQAIDELSDALSRVLLQRQRDEVGAQLPALVHATRSAPMAPAQRAAHAQQQHTLARLLAGWQRSGWLADADQWRVGQALQAAQIAGCRADPSDPASALAEGTLQALAGQLADWADTGAPAVALRCASEADRDQLAARLADYPRLTLLTPTDPLPPDTAALLTLGAPWRSDDLDATTLPRGTPVVAVVGQDSIDQGLAETLALRDQAPRGLLQGGDGYLGGAALAQWLQALQQALPASDAKDGSLG